MHVDIVKNEWLAGFQTVVAKLYLEDGAIRLEARDDARWRERLLARYEVDGQRYDQRDPEPFLEQLVEHFRAAYLWATHLHDEHHCEIPEMTRPIERVDERGVAHPAGA